MTRSLRRRGGKGMTRSLRRGGGKGMTRSPRRGEDKEMARSPRRGGGKGMTRSLRRHPLLYRAPKKDLPEQRFFGKRRRICAGALSRRAQRAVSKFTSGQSHTSSRQGVWVCGALRLPHDLIRLPSSSRKTRHAIFAGAPKAKKALAHPLHGGGYNRVNGDEKRVSRVNNPSVRLVPRLTPPLTRGRL